MSVNFFMGTRGGELKGTSQANSSTIPKTCERHLLKHTSQNVHEIQDQRQLVWLRGEEESLKHTS